MWVAGTPVPMPSPATSQQAVISRKHSTEKGRAGPSGSGPADRGSPVMECQPQLPWASERLSLLGTASARPVVLCRAAPQQPAPPGPSLLSAITAARGGLTELRLPAPRRRLTAHPVCWLGACRRAAPTCSKPSTTSSHSPPSGLCFVLSLVFLAISFGRIPRSEISGGKGSSPHTSGFQLPTHLLPRARRRKLRHPDLPGYPAAASWTGSGTTTQARRLGSSTAHMPAAALV